MQTQQVNLVGKLSTKRGATRILRVNIRDPNNTIDFSQSTLDARIAKRTRINRLASFAITYLTRNATELIAEMRLSSSQTEQLEAGMMYWECFLLIGNDPVFCVAEGDFEIRGRIA